MKRIYSRLVLSLAICALFFACGKPFVFPENETPPLPRLDGAVAGLYWIGPIYKVAVKAEIEDNQGIDKIRVRNSEWKLDTIFDLSGEHHFSINDSFPVPKDVNLTRHNLEFDITNSQGGLVKKYIAVEDHSAENLIPGYDPDLEPPTLKLIKPTVMKFLGFSKQPVNVDFEASVSDREIDSIEIRLWGESADGSPVDEHATMKPTDSAAKKTVNVVKSFQLPGAKPGQYQYIIRATDASGNKKTIGGQISVGYVDRLYFSDALDNKEIAAQGYDQAGGCRGIGTIYSMHKTGENTFQIDYYSSVSDAANIRFIAFLNSERPFTNIGGTQAGINYSLEGENVVAASKSEPSVLTTDLQQASFKLPVTKNGYYHISVDMTTRKISAVPYTPSLPADAIKYPGWSDAEPWDYLSVTGPTITGSAGSWTEVATSPKLVRDPDNKYLFRGTFQTTGSSSNMSLNAPLAVLGGDVWGKGWFRLVAARAAMKDDYGDLITVVGAVGASSGGVSWGFSTSPAGTYQATYDIILQRLRIVRIGN